MNAKQELLRHVGDRKVKYVRVIHQESYNAQRTVEGTIDQILPVLDFDYDNGYGTQYLGGTI